ncbi:MAG: hypothetical protein JSV38_11390 [Desulfobacterales bacterium]|nr:MAG: hypothetical protein JSV38_11390 [Desulfobacterales bacterium]
MKKRLLFLILLELLIVLLLTTTWEFGLETITFEAINVDHTPEDLTERLEYIITSSVFVCIALIIPFWVIIKDFSRLEKTTQRLQKALDNVKTLEGLLPMCANCKNIRDDEGYWQLVEVYIRQHSKAEFSHSICPKCLNQLYPGMFDK